MLHIAEAIPFVDHAHVLHIGIKVLEHPVHHVFRMLPLHEPTRIECELSDISEREADANVPVRLPRVQD